jgi:hypothetical protein
MSEVLLLEDMQARAERRDFAANQAWLELSLIAQDLIAWTKSL